MVKIEHRNHPLVSLDSRGCFVYKSRIPFVKDKKLVKYLAVYSKSIGRNEFGNKSMVLSINIYEDDKDSLNSFKQLVEDTLRNDKGVTTLSVDEFPDDLKNNSYYIKDNLIKI